jgi:hypothetical protein
MTCQHRAHGARQDRRAAQRQRADHHPAFGAAAQRRQVRLDMPQFGQRALDAKRQQLAGGGRHHAFRRAFEQRHAKARFEVVDRTADGRLADAEGLRHRRHVAGVGQADEAEQAPLVEHRQRHPAALRGRCAAGHLVAAKTEFVHHPARAKQHAVAERGAQHPAGLALEQVDAERELELVYRAGDGRLRPVQRFGRARHAAELGNGDKGAQVTQADKKGHWWEAARSVGFSLPQMYTLPSSLSSEKWDSHPLGPVPAAFGRGNDK